MKSITLFAIAVFFSIVLFWWIGIGSSVDETPDGLLDLDSVSFIETADHVCAKTAPSAYTYARFGEQYVSRVDGVNNYIKGINAKDGAAYQAGDYLIFAAKQAPDSASVFKGAQLQAKIPIAGVSWMTTACFAEEKLLVVGIGEENQAVFRVYNQSGDLLSETQQMIDDKTAINDHSIMYALCYRRQWLVWIPSGQMLAVSSLDFAEQKFKSLKIPERHKSMNMEVFALLSLAEMPKEPPEICSTLVGSHINSLPNAFFTAGERLLIGYYESTFVGCSEKAKQVQDLPIITPQTELLSFSLKTFEPIIEPENYPDYYVTGPNQAEQSLIGRKWVGDNQGNGKWYYEVIQ